MSEACEKDGCAACVLAEETGRPHTDFDTEGYGIPDFREQEITGKE